jgi:hypothetical protein
MFGAMSNSSTAAPTPRPTHSRTGSASSQRTATSTSPPPLVSRGSNAPHVRRSLSARGWPGAVLSPIPGSPDVTDVDTDGGVAPPQSAPPTVFSARKATAAPTQDTLAVAQPAAKSVERPRIAERQASRASLSSLRPKSRTKDKDKGKEKEREKEKSTRDKSREHASFMPDELGRMPMSTSTPAGSSGRSRSKSQSYLPRSNTAQSLSAAAAELVVAAPSPRKSMSSSRVSQLPPPAVPVIPVTPTRGRSNTGAFATPSIDPETKDGADEREENIGGRLRARENGKKGAVPPSPRRPIPALPGGSWTKRNGSSTALNIGRPVLDLGECPHLSSGEWVVITRTAEATANMTPLKTAAMGKPIYIDQQAAAKAGDRGNRS